MSKAFQDRPHAWELRKNGVAFTGGPLMFGDPYDKNNPFYFANGSGGPAATTLMPVNQNDTIELLIYKTGGDFVPATFVATTLSIELIPEPGTAGLLLGLVLAGITILRRTVMRR
jgi:hypothetical protein